MEEKKRVGCDVDLGVWWRWGGVVFWVVFFL